MEKLENCPECGTIPGQPHIRGCDVERCSVCAGQHISCGHEGHDPQFARWSGIWPGEAECCALGLFVDKDKRLPDLTQFYILGLERVFFVKPKPRE